MKNVILLKLAFMSVFTIWTITSYGQENKHEIVFSTDTLNVKASVKSDTGTVKNSFSPQVKNRSFKISKSSETGGITAGSNLIPYKPSGWDDKIVRSTVKDTHTSASTISNAQVIYLDWAIVNVVRDIAYPNSTRDISMTWNADDVLTKEELDNIKTTLGFQTDYVKTFK